MGRPALEIEAEEVVKLAELGCKNDEIADFFNCSTDTIERRFAAELRKGRVELKKSLRRCQLDVALKGNVVMLIWLGKQMLGQTDKTVVELTKIDDAVFLEEAKRRLNAKPRDP